MYYYILSFLSVLRACVIHEFECINNAYSDVAIGETLQYSYMDSPSLTNNWNP